MEFVVYVVLALAAGACLPTQAGINAQLNRLLGDSLLAATVSFAVGTVGLAVYCVAARVGLPSWQGVVQTPWWQWTGGLLGAFFVTVTIFLAPRMGAASMVALVVAGQMLASMACDHYGLVGYAVREVSPLRLLGAGLMVSGVALIRMF